MNTGHFTPPMRRAAFDLDECPPRGIPRPVPKGNTLMPRLAALRHRDPCIDERVLRHLADHPATALALDGVIRYYEAEHGLGVPL